MKLADSVAEEESVIDTPGDAHALVDTLADTLAERTAVTLGDARGDAHALVFNLADTPAEVEAVTVGDARGVTHVLVVTMARVGSSLQPEFRPVRAYNLVCHLLPPPL